MIPTKEIQQLRAFHKEPKLKKDIVTEILKHQKQDQIIKGTYGKQNGNWKGCAVGCSVRSLSILKGETLKEEYSDHKRYETDLGIPESLAMLEDYLFESMPKDKAMKWPAEFMKAIPVGADLSLVVPKFIAGILRDVVELKDVKDDKAVVKAVLDVAKLWEEVISGKDVKSAAWSVAESAARSAFRSAADSVAKSVAESAADSAFRSAAWSAAKSIAWSVAKSASASDSAAAYKMSRRLLKILRSSK